jgi:hypothetical protein
MVRPERSGRRCRLWLLALALAGCDGRALVLGAGRSAPEAGVPATEVPALSAPRLIEELVPEDGAPDDDPSLSADRLLLCFNSKRKGGKGHEDVWCSERGSRSQRWVTPAPLDAVNGEARETGIALALDGLTLWFSSDRGDQGSLDVYVSRRVARGASWSAPERVPELSTPDDDLVSAVDAEARTLYLARRQNDDDDYDLYVARRADGAAVWQVPEPLAELNGAQDESDAYPLAEDLGLIFTRHGDLYLARRSHPGEPFGAPQPMAALNSEKDDRDAWSEPDLGYVMFSSKRSGEYRLYEADALR